MEGHYGAHDWVFPQPSDDLVASEFGLVAPFWETYLRHSIFEYMTTILPYHTPP